LSTSSDYVDVVPKLRNSSVVAPSYLTVCGKLKNQGCIITRNRDSDTNFISFEEMNNQYFGFSTKSLIQVNVDWWIKKIEDEVMDDVARRAFAIKHLKKKTKKD